MFIKKGFHYSEPFCAHLHTKFRKSSNKREKFFIQTFNMGIKQRRTSRWFRIRWKGFKKMHKKVISKNVTEYELFSLLLMFAKFVLLITFCPFSTNFFNPFEISMKFSGLWYLYNISNKKFLGHITIFLSFEAKRTKRLKN
jgi:hypothetical protein